MHPHNNVCYTFPVQFSRKGTHRRHPGCPVAAIAYDVLYLFVAYFNDGGDKIPAAVFQGNGSCFTLVVD